MAPWRQGESDAAQPAAEVGRDRARRIRLMGGQAPSTSLWLCMKRPNLSYLARGGGRCQRGPGGLGPGAVRVLSLQGS